jgi:hypothetical protein
MPSLALFTHDIDIFTMFKYDDNDAKEADRTGLNVINISCANRKGTRVKNQRSVQSPLGGRGHWTGDVVCPRSNGIPLFLQSFELMVHQPVSALPFFASTRHMIFWDTCICSFSWFTRQAMFIL